MWDKDAITPHTTRPSKTRRKRPEIASQMSILLTLVHNRIQSFRENWNLSNRNSDNNHNCNWFKVLHYSLKKKRITKRKMLSLQRGIRKEKFWQSVWRSKHFMHLWVAIGGSPFICPPSSGKAWRLTFSSHTTYETRWGSVSENMPGLESAVTWDRKSVRLLIERVGAVNKKQLEG